MVHINSRADIGSRVKQINSLYLILIAKIKHNVFCGEPLFGILKKYIWCRTVFRSEMQLHDDLGSLRNSFKSIVVGEKDWQTAWTIFIGAKHDSQR